jgi:hypothetical protein
MLIKASAEEKARITIPSITPTKLKTYGRHRIPPPIAAEISVNMLCLIPPAVNGLKKRSINEDLFGTGKSIISS